jgi:hypothetical protein
MTSQKTYRRNTRTLSLSLGLPCGHDEFLVAEGSMILAPQYYGTNSILVMQASKEASIQSLILFSFSSPFSYSVFLYTFFLLDYLGAAFQMVTDDEGGLREIQPYLLNNN